MIGIGGDMFRLLKSLVCFIDKINLDIININ